MHTNSGAEPISSKQKNASEFHVCYNKEGNREKRSAPQDKATQGQKHPSHWQHSTVETQFCTLQTGRGNGPVTRPGHDIGTMT